MKPEIKDILQQMGFTNVNDKDIYENNQTLVKNNQTLVTIKNCYTAGEGRYTLSSKSAYEKTYKKARKQEKKFFFMGNFATAVLDENPWLKKYIFSIENKYAPKSDNYDLTASIKNLVRNQNKIVRYQGPNGLNTFDIIFIQVKDNENDKNYNLEYLKYYMESSDSRTYGDLVYNMIQYVKKDEGVIVENKTDLPHNLLVCGAPGTGKSTFLKDKLVECGEKIIEKMCEGYLNEQSKQEEENTSVSIQDGDVIKNTANKDYLDEYTTRVTFYEDYSYENFVGCYKPVPEENTMEVNLDNTKGTVCSEKITYKYVPGPFIETYIKASNDPKGNYYLVIEEINRAKAASVFGDMFQLLDRKNGESIYTIKPDVDLDKYLEKEIEEYNKTMCLPKNMYIWATMNSADQGVFSLDSAFKRRWNYHYMDINEGRRGQYTEICLRNNGKSDFVNWDDFRSKINDKILESGFDEDRCIGTGYFSDDEFEKIKEYTESLNVGDDTITRGLTNPLVDKLFSYLLQDVFRMNKTEIFMNDYFSMSKLRAAKKTNITEILNIDWENLEWKSEKKVGHEENKDE